MLAGLELHRIIKKPLIASNTVCQVSCVIQQLRLQEFGEPEGFTGLGKLYENGWGVPVDKTIAVKYYNMAVEAGDPGSMTRLGVMHLKGSYLPKNFEKAFEYLDRAAKLGEPEAHIVLGKMYKGNE